MRESSAHRRTCKACPDSPPDIATPGEYSSLPASRPYFLCSPRSPLPAPAFSAARVGFGRRSTLLHSSEGFRCPEHISAPKSPGSKRICRFYWVFCVFSGIAENEGSLDSLQVVVKTGDNTIRSREPSTRDWSDEGR